MWVTRARPYGWVSADERGSIENALKDNFGNKTQAARVLGMSLRQLRDTHAKTRDQLICCIQPQVRIADRWGVKIKCHVST